MNMTAQVSGRDTRHEERSTILDGGGWMCNAFLLRSDVASPLRRRGKDFIIPLLAFSYS
jgi:hypothetical protein